MATKTTKKVTKTKTTTQKGMGTATPIKVTQPETPADYKQGSYTANTYNQKYGTETDVALSNLTNWSYDPMQDANYQALAKVYNAQGNIAAKNSLADAASLNGGFGSSYAVSAAQQARNQYNQQLASMIPELENQAYQKAQGAYNALMDAENANMNRFSLNEDNRYRAATYNQDERQFGYNALLDKYNTLNNNYWQGLNYNYQLSRDKVSDERWALEYAKSKSGGGGGRRSSGGSGGGYVSSGGGTSGGGGIDPGNNASNNSIITKQVNTKTGSVSPTGYISVKEKNKKSGGRVIL